MNINVKIFNKILPNQIQECINRTIHRDQVEFILDIQGWFYISKTIDANHHMNRVKKRKLIRSNQFMQEKLLTIPIPDKNSQQTRKKGQLPHLD